MTRVLGAGAAYFGLIFLAGFVLGTLRVLVLRPHLDEFAAVALELPVMLVLSWWVAGRLTRGFAVPARAPERLAMGGVAFLMLILAEAALGVFGFGRDLAGHLAHYATLAGALGLAGQAGFALMPWLRQERR